MPANTGRPSKPSTAKKGYVYGRRVKSSGGGGKARGKRRVWFQAPGSAKKDVPVYIDPPLTDRPTYGGTP